ncbi:hypothetical protein Q1695_010806 [Nippostrongylus brasiliensis]|nr:hypothetical protein Q1695_010806 [Nippostrongylus brasiliensis]
MLSRSRSHWEMSSSQRDFPRNFVTRNVCLPGRARCSCHRAVQLSKGRANDYDNPNMDEEHENEEEGKSEDYR